MSDPTTRSQTKNATLAQICEICNFFNVTIFFTDVHLVGDEHAALEWLMATDWLGLHTYSGKPNIVDSIHDGLCTQAGIFLTNHYRNRLSQSLSFLTQASPRCPSKLLQHHIANIRRLYWLCIDDLFKLSATS